MGQIDREKEMSRQKKFQLKGQILSKTKYFNKN